MDAPGYRKPVHQYGAGGDATSEVVDGEVEVPAEQDEDDPA